MSVLSRVSAPTATHDLAGVVVALLSTSERTALRDLSGSVMDQPPEVDSKRTASVIGRLTTGPLERGTSAVRIPWRCITNDKTTTERYHGASNA